MKKVRVRFAPSPTGGLHLGGIRTALYNYAFAKKNGGDFIVRIEDTDEDRFNPTAEKHIFDSLAWAGLIPDESPIHGGNHGPYRQSERDYKKYAQELIDKDMAYYAFDTKDQIEAARNLWEKSGIHSGYSAATRGTMANSTSLPKDEVERRLAAGESHVIRFKTPKDKIVRFEDGVRGVVVFNSNEMDDKVLLKSSGIPTYHLANIVDDHLMEISHVIRGEEWLPSTSLHMMLYEAFGWESPIFFHLPLILNPDGKGKLSKRHAVKYGFSVFAVEWKEFNPEINQVVTIPGFKENGFEPGAFLNFLALLGWHPAGEKEILSLDEMIQEFDLYRVNKSGARFDYDKAKSLNSHYLRALDYDTLKNSLTTSVFPYSEDKMNKIIDLSKERAIFRKDLNDTAKIFLTHMENFPKEELIKWDENTAKVLVPFALNSNSIEWNATNIKQTLYDTALKYEVKFGKIMPGLRLALTGGLSGPDLMTTMEILGQTESARRILYLNDVCNEYKVTA
jgi:glutamyl-tRNA synthetase